MSEFTIDHFDQLLSDCGLSHCFSSYLHVLAPDFSIARHLKATSLCKLRRTHELGLMDVR